MTVSSTAKRSHALDIFVVAAGIVTTVLSLAGVYWLALQDEDFYVMGWYVVFVVPAGAILAGAASGSGYGLLSWLTGRKVGGGLMAAVAVLLAGAYAAAQWVEFAGLGLVYDSGEPVDFFTYYDLVTRSMQFSIGRAGSSSTGTTGELGILGYGFRLLELVGFVGGGLAVPFALRSKPYCEDCSIYMRTRELGLLPASVAKRKIKKSDTEGRARFDEEMARVHEAGAQEAETLMQAAKEGDAGRIREILDRHATEQKPIGKLPLRFRVQLSACPRCADGILACDILSGQGRDLRSERIAVEPVAGDLSRML